MLISCTRLQAIFAGQRIRLELEAPAPMVWDEHWGTFVLKLADLKVAELTEPPVESGCRLEISLSPGAPLISVLKDFAGVHQLPLAPSPSPELEVGALLAACHVPGQSLFIFAEEPSLRAKGSRATLEIAIIGHFKSRRVPCQAIDLIIHLTKAAMGRLVAFMLHQARGEL